MYENTVYIDSFVDNDTIVSEIKISSLNWQEELQRCITTIEELEQYIPIPQRDRERLKQVIKDHPMRIPRYYASLIDPCDPEDPVYKMIVPSLDELSSVGSFDTSGEKESTKMPGLQHKYAQDALLLSTNRCAAYCRHCFRKRLVGLSSKEILNRFNDAVAYIEDHEEINNVLITGGDPFVLPTPLLEHFLEKLHCIDHIDFIRFGTRVPVTFPERILKDPGLVECIRNYSTKEKRIHVVTQFNHPVEFTELSVEAVDRMIDAGAVMNNQAVLMKGVNDNPDVLAELFNKMVGFGINPYYLFQCRPVKKVKKKFQISLIDGYRIVEEAKKKCNGLSKRFKFVMSHYSGKIEIVGMDDKYIYLRYHQARDPEQIGRFFRKEIKKNARWLDDL